MSLGSRIANALRPGRLSREIDEEFAAHIEEAVAAGRDPEEARRAFGPALRQREAGHALRVAGWLESLRADTIFGWRQLWKSRTTSMAAVLSLALGIGSCVAAFRIMDALLWRPLPVAGADRLFAFSWQFLGFDGKLMNLDGVAHPEFLRMREAVKDQADLIAVEFAQRTDLTFGSEEEMEKAYVQHVSGWMFSDFGLKPALGRLLIAADERAPMVAPYAVLSYNYWQHRFGGDPKVIGKTMHIGNQTIEIVGVGPKGFTGTERGTMVDVFLPSMMHEAASQDGWIWERGFALLKPGVAIEPLRQKMAAVSHAFQVERSKKFTGMTRQQIDQFLDQKLLMRPAGAGISNLQTDYRRALGIIAVLVALVLLIACVNVANLMTAQTTARAHEMALRISIGAGRARLMQLILVESAMLATAASAIGAAFSLWAAPFILSMINPPDNPVRLDLPADWRVLLFGLALIFSVVLLLGLLPALRASGVQPVAALKGGDDPHARRRMMRASLALQVAFCFLVLFLSSLFVATFERLSRQPLGFEPDRLLLLETMGQKAQPAVVWQQIAQRLGSVHGVESVAISIWPLLKGYANNSFISINGAPPGPLQVGFLDVSPGWMGVMRIPFVSGRDFRSDEVSSGTAIVNETFAKTFFAGENPLGKTFVSGENSIRYQIVGVVRDAAYSNLRDATPPVAFLPLMELNEKGVPQPSGYETIAVRSADPDPLALANTARQTVAQLHTGLRVSNVSTEEELIRDQTVRERLLAMLAVFFGSVALLLAGIGLYGVLSYSVQQRRREIGIRIAIGSRRSGIVRLVTADMLASIVIGSCAGLALGLGCARYVESLFYHVKATDAGMLSLPAAAILITAALAALPAVLRAVRTNPSEILRTE